MRPEDLEELITRKPEVGLRPVRVFAERLHAPEVRYSGMVGKDVPALLATPILRQVDS